MSRINISIPDDLKAQMDEHPSINWSNIAKEAFSAQVNIANLRRSDMNTAGIERLRTSKQSNTERERAEGFAIGKKWALEEAEYDQLSAVADLVEGIGGEWDAPGVLTHLGNAVDESLERWSIGEILFGEKEPSDNMIEGFIEGAAEIFRHV